MKMRKLGWCFRVYKWRVRPVIHTQKITRSLWICISFIKENWIGLNATGLKKKKKSMTYLFSLWVGIFFIWNKKRTKKHHKVRYIKMSDDASLTKNLNWKVLTVTLGQSVYKEQIYSLFKRSMCYINNNMRFCSCDINNNMRFYSCDI